MFRRLLGAGALLSVGTTFGFLVGAALVRASARMAELDEDATEGPFGGMTPSDLRQVDRAIEYRRAHRPILQPGETRPVVPPALRETAHRYGCVDPADCIRRGFHVYAPAEMAATGE
jgi:hypothetical protein